jgi:hypothetical protein
MNYYDYYDCEVMADKIQELEELIKESNAMDTMLEGRNKTIAELENDFPMLNICDVMDWIYFTFGKEAWSMSYDWETQKLMEFCNNFNVYLYEKPRESFFKWEGIEEAEKGRYKGVIFSDLS